MNAGVLIAAAIVAAAIIIKIPIGPPPGRYQVAGYTAGFYRLDTATGDAWFLAGSGPAAHWLPFADNGGSR